MRKVAHLIGAQRAAAACVLGPTEHAGLEEGAIDDQLPAAFKKIKQANLTLRTLELVLLLHSHPRHPSALGGQSVTGAGERLLFHEELLPCAIPLLLRLNRRCLHRGILL